jgi:hypothetical protein
MKIEIYRILILLVVLFGCETWSLILRKKRRLRELENMVLRKIFGPKRNETTGEWRKLHNEELSDVFSLPNIFRVIKSRIVRWAGHVARRKTDGVHIWFLWGYLMERAHLQNLRLDGRIILKWIFMKLDEAHRMD